MYRKKWVIHIERITREKVNGTRSGAFRDLLSTTQYVLLGPDLSQELVATSGPVRSWRVLGAAIFLLSAPCCELEGSARGWGQVGSPSVR